MLRISPANVYTNLQIYAKSSDQINTFLFRQALNSTNLDGPFRIFCKYRLCTRIPVTVYVNGM